MKQIVSFLILVICGVFFCCGNAWAAQKPQLDSVEDGNAPSNRNLGTLLQSFPPGTDIKIVRSAVLREGYYVESPSVGTSRNYITFTSSVCDWPSWSFSVSYDKTGKILPDPDGYVNYSPIALNVCAKNGHFIKLKAEFGNTKAQHYLACLYTQGTALDNEAGCEIVKPDMAEALKWWRKLAGGGDERSQLFLGEIYSHVEALKRYDLGYGNDSSNGVKQDYAEAYFWYGLAVASGDKDVIPLRDNVEKHLNVSQKAAEDIRIQESKSDTNKPQEQEH